MPRKKNDILLKSIIEENFPFLLRFFFADAEKLFDFDRGITFMDKELHEIFPELSKNGGTREVDMLVKVYLLDGGEKWILVHLEIQDQYKKNFPQRMFTYFIRIYDRYSVGVTAIAVFTGKKHPGKGIFTERLLGTRIAYEYNTYHILDHSEAELLSMQNPFALVVFAAQRALMADKIPEQELSDAKLTIAKALIDSKIFSHDKIIAFLSFLKEFLYVENQEINANFGKQIDSLTGQINTMGVIETIEKIKVQEMEEKKNIEFVTNLWSANKFTISEIANFANVSEAFVRKVIASLKKKK